MTSYDEAVKELSKNDTRSWTGRSIERFFWKGLKVLNACNVPTRMNKTAHAKVLLHVQILRLTSGGGGLAVRDTCWVGSSPSELAFWAANDPSSSSASGASSVGEVPAYALCVIAEEGGGGRESWTLLPTSSKN